MLVWINGPFGVGKTTLAGRLAERWPDALVVDPEHVGMMLMQWSRPHGLGVDDFQDLPLWRELVVAAVGGLHTEVGRPLIVPMTLLDTGYFEQVVGGLRGRGIDVRHFCLTAPAAVVTGRLASRGEPGQPADPGAMTWALERLERYTPAMSDPRFGEFLDATLPPDDLLEDLLGRLPAPLPSTA